ncbi:hypothetical protein ACIO3O_41665 [Streptomyces sp. NPDC087440]|uniref:hypothetical protein n=1 Tax=Streptomyces sp. NPDC087440 TaxID=3365790 RepID=UPI003822A77C
MPSSTKATPATAAALITGQLLLSAGCVAPGAGRCPVEAYGDRGDALVSAAPAHPTFVLLDGFGHPCVPGV